MDVEDRLEVETRILRKVDRHLIPWFFSLGVCCYLDRTNLAFAAVQLSNHLHFSCSIYGLGAGLFFIGYSFQVPSNMMLHRFGARTWLSAIVIAWGCVAATFSATNGTTMFLTLRVLLGLAECGTFPGMWAHLTKFYTPRELGSRYSAIATSTALAQVIGAPLAALILSLDGLFGLYGWQWLFITEGIITILFGTLLFFFLAPSPSHATCLSLEEREWLRRRQDMQPTSSKDASFRGQVHAVLGALKNWKVWYMSALWLTVTTSMYGIIFFAPMMIHQMFISTGNDSIGGSVEIGGPGEVLVSSPSPLESGSSGNGGGGGGGCSSAGGEHSSSGGGTSGAGVALLSMVPFAAAAAAMMINARLAEAANERHRHAGIPILLGALFMGLTPLALRFIAPLAAFFCLVLSAACVWAFHAPFHSWPAVFLRGHEASAGFAVINSLGSFGGFVGPLLLGVLADRSGSYGGAMAVLAGVLGVGGVGILMFPDKGVSMDVVHLGSSGGGGGSGGEDEEEGKMGGGGGGGSGAHGERVPILYSTTTSST